MVIDIKKIIKDGRILKHFTKKYNFVFNNDYKYCIDSKNNDYKLLLYKNNIYSLRYFDGCFYPYLCLLHKNAFVSYLYNNKNIFINNVAANDDDKIALYKDIDCNKIIIKDVKIDSKTKKYNIITEG